MPAVEKWARRIPSQPPPSNAMKLPPRTEIYHSYGLSQASSGIYTGDSSSNLSSKHSDFRIAPTTVAHYLELHDTVEPRITKECNLIDQKPSRIINSPTPIIAMTDYSVKRETERSQTKTFNDAQLIPAESQQLELEMSSSLTVCSSTTDDMVSKLRNLLEKFQYLCAEFNTVHV